MSEFIGPRIPRIINLPFEGFYQGLYESEIDTHEEQESEYYAEQESENNIHPALRLSADDFAYIMSDCADYRAIHRAIAKCYVGAFSNTVSEEIGISLGLTFESMSSPREYNFETDRIFAYISDETISALFAASAADDHKALIEVLKERHTSYSGFYSYYSNDLKTWLEKPLSAWDHNELCTLLCAAMLRASMTDWRYDVYYAVIEYDGIYHEYDSGFDFTKFEQRVSETREEKRHEIGDDPELLAEVNAYESRCPDTLDLFKHNGA